MEKESESRIPFLDVHVERKEGKISTVVYRKRTHTDRYINYGSHHHPRTKAGVITCLRDRAENICKGKQVRLEKQHLERAFHANGYPKHVVRKRLYGCRMTQPQQEQTQQDDTPQEKPKMILLPYLSRVSEHIQRVCKKVGVKAVFKSQSTLRELLTKVKTPQPDVMRKGVVYRVPCMDCDVAYIGETGRNLQRRLKEHKYAVKRGDEKNGIAVHAKTHHHQVNWDGAEVLLQEDRYWKRRVLEAIEITKHAKTANLDCGLKLDPAWTPFV